MTTHLDPKFAKAVAVMRSTPHGGEREAARKRATALAADAGLSVHEAIDVFDRPAWKAERDGDQGARRQAVAERRAAIIEKYGSEERALAPCEREQAIFTAVAQWRTPQSPPHERWTQNLDGWWCGYGFQRDELPSEVQTAIEQAYPLPTTLSEAMAEHAHWCMREDEMGLLIDTSGLGYHNVALDLATEIRADIIRELVECTLPALSIGELLERMKLYQANCARRLDIEAALLRDLETLAHPSIPSTAVPQKDEAQATSAREFTPRHPSTSDGQIRDALTADPTRSDRDIARSCGCSPTTVGRARKQMGLPAVKRSVQRRGQSYEMTVAPNEQGSIMTSSEKETPPLDA